LRYARNLFAYGIPGGRGCPLGCSPSDLNNSSYAAPVSLRPPGWLLPYFHCPDSKDARFPHFFLLLFLKTFFFSLIVQSAACVVVLGQMLASFRTPRRSFLNNSFHRFPLPRAISGSFCSLLAFSGHKVRPPRFFSPGRLASGLRRILACGVFFFFQNSS